PLPDRAPELDTRGVDLDLARVSQALTLDRSLERALRQRFGFLCDRHGRSRCERTRECDPHLSDEDSLSSVDLGGSTADSRFGRVDARAPLTGDLERLGKSGSIFGRRLCRSDACPGCALERGVVADQAGRAVEPRSGGIDLGPQDRELRIVFAGEYQGALE